jgi:dTDP-4-dehydrorhamnose reductase
MKLKENADPLGLSSGFVFLIIGETSFMKIIVTGHRGFLAARVYKKLTEKHKLFGIDKAEADISNFGEMKALFEKIKPDTVIHCAAMGDIQRCDEDPDTAVRVNILGTRNIASLCAFHGTKLVYMSSDQVYNYYGHGNLREYMAPDPTNFYGLTKWEGERDVRGSVPGHHILRLSWQYGWHEDGLPDSRDGQLEALARSLREGKKVRFIPGSRQNITFVYDTVDVIEKMAEQEIPYGTYNVASENRMTDQERAIYLLKKLGADDAAARGLLVADENALPSELLTEPYYLKMAGYKMPSFEEGLERCFRELITI